MVKRAETKARDDLDTKVAKESFNKGGQCFLVVARFYQIHNLLL